MHCANSSGFWAMGLPHLHINWVGSIKERKQWHPTPVLLPGKIPWMEEPDRLQSMGSLRVGHGWATSLSCTGEGNGNPLQCSCLENPRDGGAWWAAVYGVAQSRTQLKRLSSSSSSSINHKYSQLSYLIWHAYKQSHWNPLLLDFKTCSYKENEKISREEQWWNLVIICRNQTSLKNRHNNN